MDILEAVYNRDLSHGTSKGGSSIFFSREGTRGTLSRTDAPNFRAVARTPPPTPDESGRNNLPLTANPMGMQWRALPPHRQSGRIQSHGQSDVAQIYSQVSLKEGAQRLAKTSHFVYTKCDFTSFDQRATF